MIEPIFSAELCKAELNNGKVASVVGGYAPSSEFQMQPATRLLMDAGYDVVSYSYSNEVLEAGEPERLKQLIDAIHEDFADTASHYSRQRHVGVSLGALIAITQQWREPMAETSILATAGVRLSTIIMANPFFALMQSKVRHAFKANGYNRASLADAWRDIEVSTTRTAPVDKPLVIALGMYDPIVPRFGTRLTERAWRKSGSQFDIVEKPTHHDGTINWMVENMDYMLHRAEWFDKKMAKEQNG